MRRIVAGLVLVMLAATIGCVEGPNVKNGGGETAVLDLENNRTTGAIDVRGHVVNVGGVTAKDVVVSFKFFQAGNLYLEGKLLLGDIPAGGSENYSGTFYGQPVDAATFSWEFRIEWD